METTIIITEGTSAKAQRLAKEFTELRIIFGDSKPVPDLLVKMGKYIQLPQITSPSFIHELLKACLDCNAAVLVLLSDQERALVEPQRQLFEEYNIELK